MPRQGRQPAQLTQQPKRGKKAKGGNSLALAAAPADQKSTSKHSAAAAKPGKKATRSSANGTAFDGEEQDLDAALDVYNYAARVKRPRGDVDPLARASFGSKGKGKGKGKARAQDHQEDEDMSDEDGSNDDEDEEGTGGFRVRGNEVVEFTGMKPAGFKLGMDSGDEGGFINSDDDDEEIDSDLAEDEDDEEDLPRLKRAGGSSKGKGRQTEIDLDEDEIDYDDEEGEGWMDLADVLDAGGYGTADSEEDDEEGAEDGESRAASSDEDMSSDSDDEGYDPDALDKLDSFVSGLDSKKRKSRGDDEDDDEGPETASKKKRAVLKERTEAYPEGEFTAVKPMDGSADGKVDLDDLLSSFSESKNPRLASLRKSLKPLAPAASSPSSGSAKVTTINSHLKAAGPLAAPLPGRLQDKVDREAAYEATKAETDKWNETVRRMKGESGLGAEGARHERIVLPLVGGEGDVHRDPNANELSAKFQPTNELEASIQNLLTTAQMSQSDLQKQEQAALATLDPADLAARQAELRRQRDLMYRAERKAKRVAKIKSKAYRRIHRKAKEREAAGGPQMTLEDLAELDAIDGGNRAEEERARLEIQRAKERATLKHSGKGGRWAKKIDGLEGLEEERNASIRDMVARREELRKKIAGIEDGDEVDEFASDSDNAETDSDADERDVDAIRRRAFDELAALDAKEAAVKANDPKLKGVLNMKFMRDAMARADKQVESEAEELRQRLAQMDEAGRVVDDDEEDAPAPMALSEQVQGNLGRMVFGPSGSAAKPTEESVPVPTLGNSAATTTKTSAPVSVSASSTSRSRPRPSLSNPLAGATDESNPWLTLANDESSGKLSRKMNKSDTSSAAAKTAAKADRARAKQADARAAERDDATVEIDVDAAAGIAAERRKKAKGRKGEDAPQVGKALASVVNGGGDDDASGDSDAELDEDEINAQRGKGPTAFRQRELVKEAFANDDVVADFADEKRKEMERDAPREEDITLPGWGAWAGKGAKKSKNARKFVKKIDGVDAAQRKDAKLNHVIISERKDKKAAKYMLKDLPFPYTSAAQHEHKLRTPMGPEWSTSTILRDQTIPAVLVKPGVAIRPVDRKA
ncbi:hypothetical protein JCM8115_002113 [Rhodotorula mucilaginosa]|uniref:U3 small nucleolar RNA-associated protein 14 n=1 Tax=Rhodotorula mucilaginosa TaxID=5537 RepID=A0A9P6W0Q5_RHOMI|nr:hypothetical protein C6P46_003998 [Rhodotorula mucilaginosa]TKA56860.1 hypothetical protein B0A53_01261 [Rhodotorula sp. CCFEE 5036]